MYLPNQVEPIERSVCNSNSANTSDVLPQIDCVCMANQPAPPDYTWRCVIGRTLWNTMVECNPNNPVE